MQSLLQQITSLEKELSDLLQEEEDLNVELEEANSAVKELKEEIKETENESDDDKDDHVISTLKNSLKEKKQSVHAAVSKYNVWKTENSDTVKRIEEKSRKLQRRLKAICAVVRNEYSTKCLQDDFRKGLKELTRRPDDEELDVRRATLSRTAVDESTPPPLPEDFQLEVKTISSNDYLKIAGVKPASDGPPNTFENIIDTQIPALRATVHATTAHFRVQFTENFCNSVSDLIDTIRLCATENREDSNNGLRLQKAFHSEVRAIGAKLGPVVGDFIKKAELKVNTTLRPSLMTGAAKANTAAMATVTSWGSKNRRTKQFRSPMQNGLHWGTYNATVRRNGVYTSPSAGEIDFNQELCDPCEKEFSADWQIIMDGAIRTFINESEREVEKIFQAVAQTIVTAFAKVGMESARLQSIATTANRTCSTALKNAFNAMRQLASNAQRDLNRSLLPKVTERMQSGYQSSNMAERGLGRFDRMKHALESHANQAVHSMFNEGE